MFVVPLLCIPSDEEAKKWEEQKKKEDEYEKQLKEKWERSGKTEDLMEYINYQHKRRGLK